jgi:uncharacterized protein YuzE
MFGLEDELRYELRDTKARIAYLEAILSDLIDQIEIVEEWWITHPEKGGIDITKAKKAINKG